MSTEEAAKQIRETREAWEKWISGDRCKRCGGETHVEECGTGECQVCEACQFHHRLDTTTNEGDEQP
jgi:hypothetical protein